MRVCSYCDKECDASIGASHKLTTTVWPENRIEYSPTFVMFFCSKVHRDTFLAQKRVGGERQKKVNGEHINAD
jgi:hypothetical protein